MNKGTHFIGLPMYGQLLNLLDKSKILHFSRENGGKRYVKHFDAWQHLVIMLYAVIKRFDSLREISDSMFPEAHKLAHLGVSLMPRRSTLSDANAPLTTPVGTSSRWTGHTSTTSSSRNRPEEMWCMSRR